ncbi:GntR family transcriptional regulator [Cohnella sp. CIP 111063]|jgi:GntR family transcriptional regulator|uniref:GntR family transcriptional regulator n=1 Tax=unclassified Cohnella TaxID=2636738 RepID=UPI000B8C04AB|nr:MULTISPECIES: GntR family transcriptional regulator [unclassified Cohnella]OXS59955.1 GntR family transcriptional regulator [Cohnella sp. CIP 111063]PRX72765.1 GntR family transcriptional regulator [Cohnella sp. SGD-V74]
MRTGGGWEEVEFNSREPVYLQVVRHFKEMIVAGKLEAGQVIPSRRELGTLLKINPNTAQRSYKEMEERKLIVTEGNSPSRITQDDAVLRAIRAELLGEAVDAFVSAVRKVDVPVEELLDLVKSKYIEALSSSPADIAAEGGAERP